VRRRVKELVSARVTAKEPARAKMTQQATMIRSLLRAERREER